MFPPSVLETAYARGSLKNTADGFEFLVRNTIDSGTLIGFGPLSVDGVSYAAGAITLKTQRGEYAADQLGYRTPLYFPVGSDATVRVHGQPLAPGAHHLVITASVAEIGGVQFAIDDSLTEG